MGVMKATWEMGVAMWESGLEWGECGQSEWKCKKQSENMQNAGNQCGNAGNGAGMQQIRVELRGKLDKNVGYGAEMRHTRSEEG